MKIILILLSVLISMPVCAGRYTMTDFVKRNRDNRIEGGGYGIDYKYIYASTTGFVVLSANNIDAQGGFCTYRTPERQDAVAKDIALLARAPDAVSWDVDPSTSKCINITAQGAANDNLANIDILNPVNTHHLDANSFLTYVSFGNQNPILTTNYQFGGKAYTRYRVSYNPLLNYDGGSTGVDFDCILPKQDFLTTMFKSLAFNREKKGLLYAMWSDTRVIVNGIPKCSFGYMTITLYRLVD